MEIKEKIENLLNYYRTTRSVGHTHTMFKGIEQCDDGIVLLPSKAYEKHYRQQYKLSSDVKFISLDDPYTFTGMCKPLAIDNATMYVLLQEVLAEFDRIEGESYI